jgi:Zn-dependent M28 family amino/carboxypeptidase
MHGRWFARALLPVLLSFAALTGGCAPEEGPAATPNGEEAAAENRSFDGERAYQYALDQCAIGPRPPGTEAGWATGDYIIDQLQELGWEVGTQEFDYRGVRLRNVIGRRGEGPVVILGAHYDTRPVADRDPDPEHADEPIIGGNDGASGVAVLLELADVLQQYELQDEVWLAFFDGEDSGRLEGWPFCVGSAYIAQQLTVEPAWVIVVDMVGDADQQLYYEGNSDQALRERLWDIAADLGYETFVPEVRYSMVDDHVPFLNEGIPAVDIIDFDYPYWHTIEDTCDKVIPESLERVGRVLEELLVG